MLNVIRFLLLLLLALPAVSARAQDDPAACAAIPAPGERLACYDAIFPPAMPTADGSGVELRSQQEIPARPTGRRPATIAFACTEGSVRAMFGFAGQLLSASGDNVPLSFQVDLGSTTVRNLPVSDDNRFAVLAGRDAETLLDTLEGARALRVRVTPQGARSLTVDFAWRDTAAAVTALRESCA